MNSFTEQQLEGMLRNAPHPNPPRGLKEKLIAQTRSAATKSSRPVAIRSREGWLRRWWPVLVPAGLSFVCAVVMAIQQQEVRELKQTIQTLATNTPPTAPVSSPQASEAGSSAGSPANQQQEEIAQLKQQIAKLSAEISQMNQMRSENQNLRAQLAAPTPGGGLTTEELADLQKARDRALQIQCVNNMKQMGLAVRIWAGDNNDAYPPDIVCMSNELSTPKILVCPADEGRQVAANFSSYTDANCSYEFLGARASESEPTRVMFLCPVHGNVCLVDGSVQMGVGKTHPEWLVQRDGKLYYEPTTQP